MVVGVGGAGVPIAKRSMDQGAGRELSSNGRTGLFKVKSRCIGIVFLELKSVHVIHLDITRYFEVYFFRCGILS